MASSANDSHATDTTGYGGSSTGSSATPRYQSRGYQSRFLNKSKSSAALTSENKEAGGEDDDDDDEDTYRTDQVAADERRTPKERTSLLSSSRRSISNKSPSPTLPSSHQPQLEVSGEDRYPSGRSRYAGTVQWHYAICQIIFSNVFRLNV